MQRLTSQFLIGYRSMEAGKLECIVGSIPAIELLCDRVEEVLMNKYFKGKPPSRKIYFKEEDILEMKYFLGQHGRGQKSDVLPTAP